MKKIRTFFIKDGKATQLGGLIAQLLALTAIFAVVTYRYNNILGWIILVASGTVILVFGMAYAAQAIGLKPFTNDPLGWRNAKTKATDQDEEPLPTSKPGFIARLFGRK